jgi:polyphenol oxidase
MNITFEKKLPFGTYKVFDSKPEFEFKKVHQVHSNLVIDLTKEKTPHDIQADGMIAPLDYKIPLVIVTADCLPVFLKGKNGVCFLHAGWKGLENGILGHELVHSIEPEWAFIGPHISADNYEVGPEFKDYFKNSPSVIERNNQLCFDLGQEAKRQLHKLFGNIPVDASSACTFQSQDLHSYRLNKTTERNWNVFFYER